MPADFTSLDSDRADINNLFGFATGFGTRVKNYMVRCFGASNPFGTAATRDAASVRTAGATPILDSERFIPFVQTPPATATRRGMVINDHFVVGRNPSLKPFALDTPDTMQAGGHDYPIAVNVHAFREFLNPYLFALLASGIDLNELPRRNYGQSNALKTSFIIPRNACIIVISTNGGLTGFDPDAASGEDLAIVDSSGADILRIDGGQGGHASQVRNGTVVNGRASNYEPEHILNVDIETIDARVLDTLGLRAGFIMKGGGAEGGRGDVTADYYEVGGNGNLFIGLKEETQSLQTWLTDNPAPPHFDGGSQTARRRYRDDRGSLGFAFYIRLR